MLGLGQKVWYFSARVRDIREAIVVGLRISQNGHQLVELLSKEGKKDINTQAEIGHVYVNKADAKKHAKRVIPLIKKAEETVKVNERVINSTREAIIGEPEFKDLAKKIMGPGK